MKLYTLDEVCDFQSGLWTGKKGPYKVVKVLRNTNFTKDNKLNLENIAEIKVEVKQFEKRVLEKGDILIEKSGGGPNQPVGRVVLIDKRAVDYSFSNFTSRIRVSSDDLNPNYLYWFLNYIYLSGKTENLQRRSTGIRNLQLKEYKQLVIPVPSLQEQEKIVERLDLLNKKIKIKRNITAKKIFNLELMINSYMNKFFQHSNVIKNTELGNVIETLTDYHANGSYKILKENVELKDKKDYAWMVRSTDFENNFRNKKKYITKPAYDFLSKSKIIGGELLMSKIGNAGKIYLMPKIDTPASLAMNLFLIRFNESILLNEYVYFFLSSHFGSHQIESRLKGATTQTITKDSVRSITIPLIPIKEQIKIIDKIKSFQINIDFLNKNYVQKDKKLQNLQFSLLERVFNFDQIGKSA